VDSLIDSYHWEFFTLQLLGKWDWFRHEYGFFVFGIRCCCWSFRRYFLNILFL